MIIDHQHRFIFIHIEKTGGTSCERALCAATGMDLALTRFDDEVLPGRECKHISARELRGIVGEEVWGTYFKFAVVRNPFDRLLSHWSYHAQLETPQPWQLRDWVTYPDFRSFLRGLGAGEVSGLPNLQSRMLCDDDGRLIVDFVGRFERLAEDFAAVCGRLGVDAGPLPHTVASRHEPWEACYDEAGRRVVADLDAEDFWRLGYETGVVHAETPRLGLDHVVRHANEVIERPGDVDRMVSLGDRYLELRAFESAAVLYRNAHDVSPHEAIQARAQTAIRLMNEVRATEKPALREADPAALDVTYFGRQAPEGFAPNRAKRFQAIQTGATRLSCRPCRLSVDLTSRCNLACIMCHRHYKGSEHAKRTLPYELWKKLEPWLASADQIVFGSSGESLLHPRIGDILADLRDFPHVFRILVTNGKLLEKPDVFEAVVTSIDRLGISIEGATKRTYEAIRRGADFDRLIASVRRVREFACRNGGFPELIFHTIPMRSNLEDLPALIDLAHELGVGHVACQHLTTIPGMEKVRDEQSIFDIPEAWNETLAEVIRRGEAHGIEIDFPPPLAVRARTASSADRGSHDGAKRAFVRPETKCYDPWEFLHLGPTGKLGPCCYITGAADLGESPNLAGAYNTDRMREVRRTVNSPNVEDWPRRCRSCQKRM
jgi:MoaA/NifB/PqqE/SkfB family radical SAM enzyme